MPSSIGIVSSAYHAASGGPAWLYDFTVMSDQGPPVPDMTFADGVGAKILGGYMLSDADWYFTRQNPDLGSCTETEHVLCAEVEFFSTSGVFHLKWAATAGVGNAYEIQQSGSYVATHNTGSDHTGSFGAFPVGTPFVFRLEYDETNGNTDVYVDNVLIVNDDFGTNLAGDSWQVFLNNNIHVGFRKLFYGPLSGGFPS